MGDSRIAHFYSRIIAYFLGVEGVSKQKTFANKKRRDYQTVALGGWVIKIIFQDRTVF